VRVLTATPATQGDRPDDVCFTTDGELVSLPVLECSCPDCGCARAFAGLESHRATTTCRVSDVPLTADELRDAVVRSLAEGGWLVDLDAPADDPAPPVVEALADLHRVATDPVPLGPGAALSALDRDLVDDVVVRMVEVASAFPVDTVLGRDDGGVVVRRPAPAWAGVEGGG
jgi:hypothetical protein